jgi:hypothetical protein
LTLFYCMFQEANGRRTRGRETSSQQTNDVPSSRGPEQRHLPLRRRTSKPKQRRAMQRFPQRPAEYATLGSTSRLDGRRCGRRRRCSQLGGQRTSTQSAERGWEYDAWAASAAAVSQSGAYDVAYLLIPLVKKFFSVYIHI